MLASILALSSTVLSTQSSLNLALNKVDTKLNSSLGGIASTEDAIYVKVQVRMMCTVLHVCDVW
jgi:hypothetical protein